MAGGMTGRLAGYTAKKWRIEMLLVEDVVNVNITKKML